MNLNNCPFFKHTATRMGAVLTTMVFMLLSALATPAAAQGIPIDVANFPDAAFREFIKTGTHSYYLSEGTTEPRRIDYNQDGVLSEEERNNVTHLRIESGIFDNLTGIKNFTNLKELNVTAAAVVLTHLDLSGLTKLEELYVYNIGLESLKVAGCSALRRLSCANNQLTGSLDVSGCTALETVTCYNNQLTGTLDLSNRTSLRYIDCSNNLLESLNVSGCTGLTSNNFYFGTNLKQLNINGCTALTRLDCYNGQLESLDAGNCSAMVRLGCWNNRLTSLNVIGCPALDTLYCNQNLLTSLDVSGYTNLKVLYCYNNQLTGLNVSGCTSLISNEFIFSNNPLKQLNVNGCTALTELRWSNSQLLESLDAGDCTNLTLLGCWNNHLTYLNVSGCTALHTLWCHNNWLESLDVRNNTTLKTLWCQGNRLPSLDVSGCTALTSENDNFLFLSDNPLTSLNVSGCEALTYLQCSNNLLESLNVSGCTAMTYLDCKGNQLSSLNISNTPALAYLDCSGNQLTSFEGSASLQTLWCYNNKLMTTLNVDACTELNSLRCYDNALTGLDVSACTKLTELWCHNNSALTSLDVTQNKALMYLYCFGDGLTNLKADNLTALTNLWCYANPLTSLNVSGCTALTELKCYNSLLDSLNVSGCTSLTFNKLVGNDQDGTKNQLQPLRHLNVSGCTALTQFDIRTVTTKLESLVARSCTGIKQLNAFDTKVLKSLDVSGCTGMEKIFAYNNQLTSLNVSGCTSLTTLSCHHNQLDSLDVSTCEALQSLQCEYNRLDSLDASGCTNLTYLSCNSNKLKRLNVSGCVALEKLFCQINALDSLTITDHKALQQLVCWSNGMKRLNVSGCTALSGLKCNTNKLESLNVSGCVELDSLYCYDNKELKQLDVSSCTDLDNLYCYGSGLEDLNVNGCDALKNLWCSDNNLAELELNTCTALSNLQCNNNLLESLDVSQNTLLLALDCSENKLPLSVLHPIVQGRAPESVYRLSPQFDTIAFTGNEPFDLSKEMAPGGTSTKWTAWYADNTAVPSGLVAEKDGVFRFMKRGGYRLVLTNAAVPNVEYRVTVSVTSDLTQAMQMDLYVLRAGVPWDFNLCGKSEEAITCYVDWGDGKVAEMLARPAIKKTGSDEIAGDSVTTLRHDYADTGRHTIKIWSEKAEQMISFEVDGYGNVLFNGREYRKDEVAVLTMLDVSRCPDIRSVTCQNNRLKSLNVGGCTTLQTLSCSGNQLMSLDISKNTALLYLNCGYNPLTSLDVTKNINLEYLDCSHCNYDGYIQGQLTVLKVSGCTALQQINCYGNALSSLDVSGCTALFGLYCNDNQLTSLKLNGCTRLVNLSCYNNNLSSLDVRQNTALKYIDCYDNRLTNLDVRQNTDLIKLNCYNNLLTSLDVSQNTNLYSMDGCNNHIPLSELRSIMQSHPDNNYKLSPQSSAKTLSKNEPFDLKTEFSSEMTIDGKPTQWRVKDGSLLYSAPDGSYEENNGVFNFLKKGRYMLVLTNASVPDVEYRIAVRCDLALADTLRMKVHIQMADVPWYFSVGSASNIYVDWGDKTAIEEKYPKGNIKHTYADTGSYAIKVWSKKADQITRFDANGHDVLSFDGTQYGKNSVGVLTSSLDISDCMALESLECRGNQLTGLDVSANTVLTNLYCVDNQLSSLDISQNIALQSIDCGHNHLSNLDVSKNIHLTSLACYGNPLKSLDVSRDTVLQHLSCWSNQLSKLDVSKNIHLYSLHCEDNQLTSLDISKNTALSDLRCENNQLTSLDVSKNLKLGYFDCSNNQLTNLDVRRNTDLITLGCHNNQLSRLDMSQNTALQELSCYENHIPLSNLYAIMRNRPAETRDSWGYRLTPQNSSKTLKVDESFDLSTEMFFGTGNRTDTTKWEVINFYSGASSGIVAENKGVFRFLKAGVYHFILTNNSVRDYATNWWYNPELNNNIKVLDTQAVVFTYTVRVKSARTQPDTLKMELQAKKAKAPWDLAVRGFYGDTITCFVNWGDGTAIDTVEIAEASDKEWYWHENRISHAYANIGTYAVKLWGKEAEQIREIDVDGWGGVYSDEEEYSQRIEVGVLSSLDVSGCPGLMNLNCRANQLLNLDVSKNLDLITLICEFNQLSGLDVSQNVVLQSLICNNNQLTNLDMSKSAALMGLNCAYNQLTKLDVNQSPDLQMLSCNNNQLTSLDVSGSAVLTELNCADNQLTKLDVNQSSDLQLLICNNNQLTSLDVSGSAVLEELDCNNNRLASLKIHDDAICRSVRCANNSLPLSSLYPFMRHRPEGVNHYFSPQSLTMRLRANEDFDLSSEMNIGGVPTQWQVEQGYKLDSTSAPDGIVEEDKGVFRFLENGNYRLVLQNKAVQNHTEGWIWDEETAQSYLRIDSSAVVFEWTVTVSDTIDPSDTVNKVIITLQANDPNKGSVNGSGNYEKNTNVTIRATPKEGYRFTCWMNGEKEFSNQAIYTFVATEHLTLVAVFDTIPSTAKRYTITVLSFNSDWGSVSGGGDYEEDDYVTIKATPKEGFRFVVWICNEEEFSDQRTYTFKATEDLTVTAYFEPLTANEDVQENKIFAYAQNRVIYLSEPLGKVQVFNMMGQCVYAGTDTAIPVPTQGVYILRAGTRFVKVMVP